MAALTFADARRTVIDKVRAALPPPKTESIRLAEAAGRILAQPIHADRDYPPQPRSMRDGFAVRAADLPGTLELIGEVRAGQPANLTLAPGQAIEIMTGATIPPGADSVVMIEHTTAEGALITIGRALERGANINPQGCDAAAGAVLLQPGHRIGYPEQALLASVGAACVTVYLRPRVAILATGDELVEIDSHPSPHQIRNSNSWSLAHQVLRAGGEAIVLPIAPDRMDATIDLIHDGLQADLLLLSGGVSAGKYDLVENALRHFAAQFYFDRVLIQPGQPCVFGEAGGTFFFGLPGNPASTMVCFEVFARAAVELLAGVAEPMLNFTLAPLAAPFHHKAGLTRFLPARLLPGGTVAPLRWSGSGDIASITRANCYLVAAPDRPEYAAAELIQILPL
ncbi:MAG: molybdopterin molybdotransferase MoeA [Bryobacterales bacterium]|nr:molybdopterin molybdotransferase MoeA [Bryobacterales bacterium]